MEVHNSLFEQLQEAVQNGPKPQEVKVVNVQKAENWSKKKKEKDYPRRHSWGAIQSSNCQARKFKVKKRKLELEVSLLEQKVCSVPGYQVSINLSP